MSGHVARAEFAAKGTIRLLSPTLALTRTYFVAGHGSYECVYNAKKFAGSLRVPGYLLSVTATATAKLDRRSSSRACSATEAMEATLNVVTREFEEPEPIWGEG